MRRAHPFLVGLLLLTSLPVPSSADSWGERVHRGMTRGFGLAPDLGLDIEDLRTLKSWGADHFHLVLKMRYLPVVERGEKVTFSEEAWRRLDSFLQLAKGAGLKVVLLLGGEFHDYFFTRQEKWWRPEALPPWLEPKRRRKLASLWREIAKRYASDREVILGYNILDEPHPPLTKEGFEAWNEIAAEVAKAIREVDKYHTIVVTCAYFGVPKGMEHLKPLPVKGAVYCFTMYLPHAFTHQGIGGRPFGVVYPGPMKIGGKEAFVNHYWLERALKPVDEFQRRTGARIYVGGFSAIRYAPKGSAYQYVRDLIELFEERGWSWAYHSFRGWDGWDAERCSVRECRRRHKATARLELLKLAFRGRFPLSWRGLFGLHYTLDEPTVETIRGAPLHQWGDSLDVTEGEHKGAVPFRGPFSGKLRYLDFHGKYQRWKFDNDAVVEEAGRKGLTILPCFGPPRKFKLPEETTVWQDVVYAQVLRYNTGRFALFPLRYWQLGNEINSIGMFNILGIKPRKGESIWKYFNLPEQAKAYVNLYFAPTAVAVRRASKDAYGDEGKVRIVLGSVANAYNPRSREWMDELLSRSINSPTAPELNGKAVFEVADILSFHYLVTAGRPDWEEALDEIYRKWVASGRMLGMWATEEHGRRGRGFVTVCRVAARWLHFWCTHKWLPERGRCIFWGADLPKPGGKGIEAVRILGRFLEDWPLKEVTGSVKVYGAGRIELYAFLATTDSAERRLLVLAFPVKEKATVREVNFVKVLPEGNARVVLAHADRPREGREASFDKGKILFDPPLRLEGGTEDVLLIMVRGGLTMQGRRSEGVNVLTHATSKLLLLVAPFSEPRKDLVAATLSWMAEEAGFEFDVFYAARTEGGLFSTHGSTMAGGHRLAELWRAASRFETTVVVLGELGALREAVAEGAKEVVEGRDVVPLYAGLLRRFGLEAKEAVAVQTEGLPEGLKWGVAQYFGPEIRRRKTLGLPLELSREEIKALKSLGIERALVVCAEGADLTNWREEGLDVEVLERLKPDESYASLSRKLAERLDKWAKGVDICEPVLASYWLPHALRERRLVVCFEDLGKGSKFAADFAERKGDFVVHGRYGGGPIGGARSDEDLFPLFERGISFQVVEPGRPPLTVFLRPPRPLPEGKRGPFDFEPSDEELRRWAREGRILATIVFHSGELSHFDAALSIMDLCASTGVKVGIPVHVQRYLLGGEFIEALHTLPEEGGVMGLCEPVLHSSGFGILAESLADPRKVASLMAEARRRVAEIVGERSAPRGVYCYLDALPREWERKNEALWRAVGKGGFSYLVSTVKCGQSEVLFRGEDFVVISQCGHLTYPYSPFARVDGPEEMAECERRLAEEGRPGFIVAVLDSPIYAYPAYLSSGDPFHHRRLAEFFDYLKGGGVTGKLVNTTPHVVARYARLLLGRR